MNLEQCYAAMGGDYAEVVSRLRTDERIAKFLRRVPSDPNYQILCDAIASGNVEEAFRASHTIKGYCLNLSLSTLLDSACAITEALRGKTAIGAEVVPLFETLKRDYEKTIEAINNLDEVL